LWFIYGSSISLPTSGPSVPCLDQNSVIFAMVVYVYAKPSLTDSTNTWLLAGCMTAALFLLIAAQLASQ
jgi:hypothetical protein